MALTVDFCFCSWLKPETLTHNLVSVARWSLLARKTRPVTARDTATEQIRLVAAIHQRRPRCSEMKQPGKKKPVLASWVRFPGLTGENRNVSVAGWGEGPDPHVATYMRGSKPNLASASTCKDLELKSREQHFSNILRLINKYLFQLFPQNIWIFFPLTISQWKVWGRGSFFSW